MVPYNQKKPKNPLPPTWAGCHVLSKFFQAWILHFQKTYSILYTICIGRVNLPLSRICNCTESAISTAEGYQLQLPLVHQRMCRQTSAPPILFKGPICKRTARETTTYILSIFNPAAPCLEIPNTAITRGQCACFSNTGFCCNLLEDIQPTRTFSYLEI